MSDRDKKRVIAINAGFGVLTALLILAIPFAFAPPSPHNMQGRVFNTEGSNGVPNGIWVFLNNTNLSGTFVYTQTSAPPPPQFRGSYSATINGTDNDTIEAWSWNATHYGYNRTNLTPTTTSLNIVLSSLRPSETNLTIHIPINNTLLNVTNVLYFNATVGVMGANGLGCNVTLSFNNERPLNVTQDQNLTNLLSDMPIGTTKLTRWNVSAYFTGRTNVTIFAQCAGDGINFQHLNIKTVFNLTVQDPFPPNITLISPSNHTPITADASNYADVTFYYNVTDGSPIKNCTLIINNRLNASSTDVSRGVVQSLSQRLIVGSYNWTVNCTDNSTIPQQNSAGTWYYNLSIIQNLPPVVRNMSLVTPFDLTPATTTLFLCNFTVFDQNNISNLTGANATLFQRSIGNAAPDDNNNHYTNSSCHAYSNSTYEANYTCGFRLQYFANNGTWTCNATVADSSGFVVSLNRSFVVNELLAIEVSPNTIHYGKMQATNISSDDVNMTVTNRGNTPFNVSVAGYGAIPLDGLAMQCETGTIPIGNQRYSANHSRPISGMVPLTGLAVDIKNFTLPQRTDDSALGQSSNLTYWKLQVPSGVNGQCNGTVVFRTYLGP